MEIMAVTLRLFAKRRITEAGCWEWATSVTKDGYGQVSLGLRNVKEYAHRAAYTIWFGPIPAGLEIDHLCRNRRCFNPAHLEAVTRSVNTKRGSGPSIAAAAQRAKTHCPHGHPYDETNTRIVADGSRACRTCEKARHQRYRDRGGVAPQMET